MSWIAALALIAGQDHMHMPGMTMPMPAPRRAPKAVVRKPAKAAPRKDSRAHAPLHSKQAMPAMELMDHSAMGHIAEPAPAAATDAPKLGTDLPPGDASAPPAPEPHYADRIWDPAAMARGREIMMRDDGGARTFAQAILNIAEYSPRRGGYRWDAEAWIGGDLDRLVIKGEGDGGRRGGVEAAEIRALYSRAIGPYFNLQAGVRQDLRPTPARTFATIGITGLAPYWFEVEAAAFVSTRGEMLGRVEAYYDQRLTQRLILQPRAEFNLSAGGTRAIGLRRGVTAADLGLRLRYEVRREFAPYVGVTWERALGGTARLARAAGRDPGGAGVVLGIRGWF
jgi:copper resistance protein B